MSNDYKLPIYKNFNSSNNVFLLFDIKDTLTPLKRKYNSKNVLKS